MLHFLLLAGCAVAIYFSCEWFVNAVEWLGQRLKVGPLAVGTILAALGTALPESVVTLVAAVFGKTSAEKDIGVGAAMGGPLALATIAYGVTGFVLLSRRRTRPADLGPTRKLARDQTWFLAIFVVKVVLGLVAFAWKPWLGLLFFAAYAVYFWRELRDDSDHGTGEGELGGALEPLLLQRHRPVPSTWAIAVQTLGTLGIIFVASQLFVDQLNAVGPMLGLPAAVTALLLSPIATELPETMNAIIWVRQGKTPLALANISGAMMIQATVPSGIGLLATPWKFDASLVSAGVVTMIAISYLLLLLRRGRLTGMTLAWATAFYAAFAISLAFV